MKLLVLYRPNSEHSTELENYIHEFSSLHEGKDIDLLDIDSVEGITKAELYGIVQQPALLVVDNDDKLTASWVGETLPLMDEVAGYLNS